MSAAGGTEDGVALGPANLISVRWRPFRLPMRHRFEAAHGALDDREGLLLELVGIDGVVGMGEASPMASIGGGTLADVLALLAGHGRALFRDHPLQALTLDGAGVSALRCAIDVALLDLEGRRRGVTVAELLSSGPAAAVAVNAIIGGGEPSDVARHGREAAAAGYRVLKLKVGVGSVGDDVARVTALREACPEALIRLDANGAWAEEQAEEALRAFEPSRIELLEQPVPATEVESLARLRRLSLVTLGADEALRDAGPRAQVLSRYAADLLVLKPMVLGGLRPALALAQAGVTAGMGAFATTTFDSSVGTAAALHLAAALNSDVAHGLGTGEHLAGDLLATTLVADGGWMRVPTGEGLGVEVDARALEEHATGAWQVLTA